MAIINIILICGAAYLMYRIFKKKPDDESAQTPASGFDFGGFKYDKHGIDQNGYDLSGRDAYGYDEYGLDESGYDMSGHDQDNNNYYGEQDQY